MERDGRHPLGLAETGQNRNRNVVVPQIPDIAEGQRLPVALPHDPVHPAKGRQREQGSHGLTRGLEVAHDFLRHDTVSLPDRDGDDAQDGDKSESGDHKHLGERRVRMNQGRTGRDDQKEKVEEIQQCGMVPEAREIIVFCGRICQADGRKHESIRPRRDRHQSWPVPRTWNTGEYGCLGGDKPHETKNLYCNGDALCTRLVELYVVIQCGATYGVPQTQVLSKLVVVVIRVLVVDADTDGTAVSGKLMVGPVSARFRRPPQCPGEEDCGRETGDNDRQKDLE